MARHPEPVTELELRFGSPDETRGFARRLGELLKGGEVLALRGDLGAGKTTFVQGLADGLGIGRDQIASPTFVLAVQHRGKRLGLNHVDLYRLDEEEAIELGLEELMTGPGSEAAVTALEWAERAEDLLPLERIEVNLSWLGQEVRQMTISAFGVELEELLGRIAAEGRD